MEDNRPGSQPEINSDYIDKLLSMPREIQEKSVRKAADTPPASYHSGRPWQYPRCR